MSHLKDILNRFRKERDEPFNGRGGFPTRVQGKTADEWAEVLHKANQTAVIADRQYDRALQADWRKDPEAYARHYGYPLEGQHRDPAQKSFEGWRQDRQQQER